MAEKTKTKRSKASPSTKEIRVVFQHGASSPTETHVKELGTLVGQWVSSKVSCRKHDIVLRGALRFEVSASQTVVFCSPCCVRSESDVRRALRQLETQVAARHPEVVEQPQANAAGANTPGEDEGVVHVNVRIHPSANVDFPKLTESTTAYMRRKATCPHHEDVIVSARTVRARTTVTHVYEPCCDAGRCALLKAKTKFEAVMSAADRGEPVKLPEGGYLVSVPRVPPGAGTRPVSSHVAARYAQMGRLQHVVRRNDGSVDVFLKDETDEKAPPIDPSCPPRCNAENIRVYAKKPLAEVTELALKEGRPLSDYAVVYDWDTHVVNVQPAPDVRALFVKAGDCPALIEELDANGGETVLLFVFANNRYDRTVRLTTRGYVVGHAGSA